MKLKIFGQWLLFGCLFACLGFVELVVATHRVLYSLLVAGTIGIGTGLIAGSVFLLLIRLLHPSLEHRASVVQRTGPSRLVEIAVVVALASGSGIARSAGAPWYVFFPLVVAATIVLVGARLLERRRRTYSGESQGMTPPQGHQPPGWFWDEESARFRPPRPGL